MSLSPPVQLFFFSSSRRHTRCYRDWSSDVCSSDLADLDPLGGQHGRPRAGTAPPARWVVAADHRPPRGPADIACPASSTDTREITIPAGVLCSRCTAASALALRSSSPVTPARPIRSCSMFFHTHSSGFSSSGWPGRKHSRSWPSVDAANALTAPERYTGWPSSTRNTGPAASSSSRRQKSLNTRAGQRPLGRQAEPAQQPADAHLRQAHAELAADELPPPCERPASGV